MINLVIGRCRLSILGRHRPPVIIRETPDLGAVMARVALVNLASLEMPGNEPIFPIGLRCVQDALDRAGHHTQLIDLVEDPQAHDDLSWAAQPWDVIGFTIRNIDPLDLACDNHVEHYVEFVNRVRAAAGSRCPLFVGGGPGYSLFADVLLPLLGFDVGVVGPGENMMLDIVASPEAYRGTGRNLGGGRYGGFTAEALRHPPSLLAAYARSPTAMIGVEAKRKTCYQGCSYCPYAHISGENKGELKPRELLAEELRAIHAAGIRRVFFTDSIFNSELRPAKEVVRTIAGLALPGLTWCAYFTPKPFDDELAELLVGSGVDYVLVSPDSLDDGVMRALGKSFRSRHVDRFVERCRQRDLPLRVNVVFGGPGETRETVRATARCADAMLSDDELVMNLGYRVLPSTAMARQLGLADSDLLSPTFYPFDPELFSWVIEEVDQRFVPTKMMFNILAGRVASRKMFPLRPQPGAAGQVMSLPYLPLTRQRWAT
ncbi:B12-binding domain-containing radical SAM protein [Amycolatopsis dendrobii]|uniref:B12-binding domain-containing radical SAM protein n=1 Tax=Amycolatopsis dendrobii TaxID=2760662 RepID=A0A7W3ZEJ7_9PSEU|nr:B12-binding domain-containing radical SAM protein [Amycolatopsis dendrobii]MBB1158666.1 B12-binding domain-containing radical SAM protein [Amycolatopsis dendrobii]